MNNKGVTLIELLIVIVVIGIISAFAVPAVGSFLESAQKQAVYQDAVAVRNAAANYCAQPTNTCTANATAGSGTELAYSDLTDLLDGFDAAAYDTEAADVVAKLTATNTWLITLESATDDDSFEYVSSTDPVNGSADDVTVDAD